MKQRYDVAAYVWPSYTGDEPRSRIFWPEGVGEWQTVREAGAKFPGHRWPRRPVWGYVNEADRYVMEMEIEAAVDHGVNVFLYDWYWYDGRPFLENCLNDGFLKAKNNEKMHFFLMWANHDATYLWDKRNASDQSTAIWRGGVGRAEFERAAGRIVDRYFGLPNYYRIDGRPVLDIYMLENLLDGLGGIEETKSALDWLQNRCIQAGFPGVYLMLSVSDWLIRPYRCTDGRVIDIPADIAPRLGFHGATHYQFCHFTNIDQPYPDVAVQAIASWETMSARYGVAYYPHVSVGWDNNPRFPGQNGGQMEKNTPEEFEKALLAAKRYVDAHPQQPKLITLNSWNEWTETSYLQPDDQYGYAYLEAVKRVFVR